MCFSEATVQENAARTGSAALKRGATASMNNFFRRMASELHVKSESESLGPGGGFKFQTFQNFAFFYP